MGFVNQAINKIKSQVPDKKEEKEEETKPSLEFDKTLNRWLINGKVPDDEEGPVEIN